jgi:hypothetical protein
MRDNSFEVFPHPRSLERIAARAKVQDGVEPKVYANFRDCLLAMAKENDWEASASLSVEVICDEMKLQSNCFYNCKDDSFAGVTASERSNTLNLGEELEALLASDEVSFESDGSVSNDEATGDVSKQTALSNEGKDDNNEQEVGKQEEPATKKAEEEDPNLYEPITYVNLFRIRNVFNRAMNGEFFFNTGSFTGDDMLAQIIHVISCLELVGFTVKGTCMDAGGTNASLLKALMHQLIDGRWVDSETYVFNNPVDPSRTIAFIFCAVHGLKAFRNTLLRSVPEGSRNLKLGNSSLGWEAGEASFGWKQILDVYERMEAVVNDNGYRPVRNFVHSVAYPDKASLMRVPDAKVPFLFDMIVFQIDELAEKLKCDDELRQVRKTFEYTADDADRLEGYLSVLIGKVMSDTDERILSKIAEVEYAKTTKLSSMMARRLQDLEFLLTT